MYQYTFDDETTQKVAQNSEKVTAIFDQFNKVDQKYSTLNNVDVDLNLKEMEYEAPSVEEIKTKAENSLQEYKSSNLDGINNNFEAESNKLDKSIEETKQNSIKQQDQIKEAYAVAKNDASNDAIKRGLARSSIIVNTLADFDNGMLSKISEEISNANAKIEGYENERSKLETERQNALNSFNISYAVKLQEKIDDLNKQVSDKQAEVVKYNNQITEAKAKWEKQQGDDNFDKTTELAKLIGEYSSSVFDVLKQNEKYEIAKTYLSTFSKQDAIAELTNNEAYLTNLGQKNFDKLLSELKEEK